MSSPRAVSPKRVFVVVNSRRDLHAGMTTARLVGASVTAGYDTRVAELDGLGLDSTCAPQLEAAALSRPDELPALLGELVRAPLEPCTLGPGDVVLVRVNPARFGLPVQHALLLVVLEQAQQAGCHVVNAPGGLRVGGDKALLPQVAPGLSPEQYTVSTVVAAERALQRLGGTAVLKPLVGTRGRGVCFVEQGNPTSRVVIELLLEGGPLLVQRRVDTATTEDVRVLVVDGAVLQVGGQPVAVRRRAATGEFRANLHRGGRAELARLQPSQVRLLDALAPPLRRLGLRAVGVDILGDRIIELNVWAPGGVGPFERLTGHDASLPLLRALVGPAPEASACT